MSLAIIYTRALMGMEAPAITVEAHISHGLPGFTLVGLPETAVKEAKDRVRSALINSGFTFPAKRITVNLAPADLPKEGGRYDLPIAIAILAASSQLPQAKLSQYEFVAELALSGQLRPVYGALAAMLAANQQTRQLILSIDNQTEIALMADNHCLFAQHLLEIVQFFNQQTPLATSQTEPIPAIEPTSAIDLQEVIGQQQAKRALEVTAAGGHNLLLVGPPGTGKTLLASRLTTIMPPLTDHEALENALISSIVDGNRAQYHGKQRPFRAPHHSASIAALVGGGSLPKPGEITLAHNGVLFLDELPEFQRRVLDALRQPLESGEVLIARAQAQIRFPARFQLIAAMNPSPTGHYRGKQARNSPQQILRYLQRLSGPFLDRFDISIEVPPLPTGQLRQQQPQGETSQLVKQRVIACRLRQYQRANKLNAFLSNQEINQYCRLKDKDADYLEQAINQLGLSVRAWHRILKVARTLADLQQHEQIARGHLLEALQYRAMDRLLAYLYQNSE